MLVCELVSPALDHVHEAMESVYGSNNCKQVLLGWSEKNIEHNFSRIYIRLNFQHLFLLSFNFNESKLVYMKETDFSN